jgi:predicted amidohydrolase
MDSRLYIGAFIISPDRAIDLYTKQRLGAFSESARVDGVLPPAEATTFHPGDRNPLVRFDGHTAAVAVCADTGRASHPQAAAVRGAGTYLASMFVIPSEFERETANLGGYAARHAMAVVFANYGGPSGGLASAGRSTIWSEQGERLVQLETTGAGVAVAIETPAGWRATAIRVAR